MSWSYLEGKKWAEVSRDERFFCQRLYARANDDLKKFTRLSNELSPGLNLDESADWEIGFEVCFFRDVKHLRGDTWNTDHHYSPKRTFDLCLFSEKRIVIIEAKAQQSFESDAAQLGGFKDEKVWMQEIVGSQVKVDVLTLASGIYLRPEVRSSLGAKLGIEPVSWEAIARAYEDDQILMRAEDVYEPVVSGINNEGHKTGEELVAAWKSGMKLLVGRKGGLGGSPFQLDVTSGGWRMHRYETREAADSTVPNANWFPLEQFANSVQ